MNNDVLAKCDLFADNLNALIMPFLLENHLIKVASAAAFTQMNKAVDIARIKECLKLLRKKQGIFSDFRSYNELVVVTKISFRDDPEQYIDDIIDVYSKLQKGKLFGSSYRALAATIIVDAGKKDEAEAVSERTEAILKALNQKHPFLTNDQDTGFAVLLSMTGKQPQAIADEVEEAYNILKDHFTFHPNATHSLCQVLAADNNSSEESCNKVLEVFDAFKEAGINYGKEYELATLAALINIDKDKVELAKEIKEVADYLKTKKGFKMLDMSSHTRLMFAAMIIADVYGTEDKGSEAAAIQGTVAAAIAQEAALMMTVVAASSASSAAHSSN